MQRVLRAHIGERIAQRTRTYVSKSLLTQTLLLLSLLLLLQLLSFITITVFSGVVHQPV
jgi:hypothetical protein